MTEPAEPRQITDSKVLAAMAHPLRRRLIDVLKVHGPATASVLAERTGQAVGNVSHHLRVLAEADLVGLAPELARDRRERWWRLLAPSVRWSIEDFADDPADAAIAQAVSSLNLERHIAQAHAWYATDPDERAWWQNTPFSTDKWLNLAPDELAELSRQVIDLFDRWADRSNDQDGQQRKPVLVFAYGVPGQP
jgi:DNA-binding transcriptional ArsR family regulator